MFNLLLGSKTQSLKENSSKIMDLNMFGLLQLTNLTNCSLSKEIIFFINTVHHKRDSRLL